MGAVRIDLISDFTVMTNIDCITGIVTDGYDVWV